MIIPLKFINAFQKSEEMKMKNLLGTTLTDNHFAKNP